MRAAQLATSGKPISVRIIETYRRLIKNGLPSVEDRLARRGLTISEIARITETDRCTVYKYVKNLMAQEERRLEREKRLKAAPKDGDMPGGVP